LVTPIFFYGSLRDRGLLEVVLGRAVDPGDVEPGCVEGHVARRVAGEGDPVLSRASGARTEGVIVHRLSEADLSRLAYFMAAEHRAADHGAPLTVATASGDIEARYFRGVEQPAARLSAEWVFADWLRDHRAVAVEAARECMDHFGRLPVERVAVLRSGIRTRARQRVRARSDTPRLGAIRTPFAVADVDCRSVTRAYSSFFAVQELRLRHRRFDGGWTEEIDRTAVLWGDAVTLLPYDPQRDRVLLIEQFRSGPTARGDRNPWCIEVVAGLIDRPESAEATARREAREEAGLEIGRVVETGRYYTTPGTAAEFVTGFVGEAGLRDPGGLHGQHDEHEDIRTIVLPFDQAMAAIESGAVNTSPALVALLWLAAHRERLRREWAGK
jgi:nudix-type nucleoside diphosphatase (YffH/AdpP family)